LEEWERPGKKLEPWAETGSARDASRKPYTPEGAQGSKSSQVRSVRAASEPEPSLNRRKITQEMKKAKKEK
jgi:hypothetical protein